MNQQLSEFIGAFIGDGCMCSYSRKNRPSKTTEINFIGSWKNDSQYYQEIIKNIIERNFKMNLKVYHRKDNNTVRTRTYNKKIIEFLKYLGYKPGSKDKSVFIPNKILKDNKLSIACVRGIFNTDGCIYKRYSKKYNKHKKIYSNYKIIQFKLNSQTLLKQIKFILNRENIKTNKIIKDKEAYVLRITSQEEVNKFIDIIKFNHKHHINRLKQIH